MGCTASRVEEALPCPSFEERNGAGGLKGAEEFAGLEE